MSPSISCLAVATSLASCDRAAEGWRPPPSSEIDRVTAAQISEDLAEAYLGRAVDRANLLIRLEPNNPEACFLLARAEARLSNVGRAVTSLKAAFRKGLAEPRVSLKHHDLDGLRGYSAFVALARRYGGRASVSANLALQPDGDDSEIHSGDASITESSDSKVRIRAGDVVIED